MFILQSSNTQNIYYRLETDNIELRQYTIVPDVDQVEMKRVVAFITVFIWCKCNLFIDLIVSKPPPLMATVQTQQIRD